MRVVFAAGGTGGHIYPALAVAREVTRLRPDAAILFIGGTRGIEQKIVGDSGFPVETIPAVGMPRKLSPAMLTFIWQLGRSVVQSRRILRKFRPDAVVATGGYVAGPTVIAARTLGIPAVIQEQNSFPGIVNRKFARWADIVFLGFEDARKYFTGPAEVMFTGNPVRNEIGGGTRETAAESFGLNPALPTLLVFGGSQGSRAINRAVSGAVERIAERGVQVLWQTGDTEFESWRRFDGGAGGRIRVLPFIRDMAGAYAASDLAVARAGAISIAEMTVSGLPAVFIPLPTAAENHQEHNARSLETAGAARVIVERDLTPELLAETALEIISAPERLTAMSDAAHRMGRTDAARKIAETILERYGTH